MRCRAMGGKQLLRQRALIAILVVALGLYTLVGCITAARGDGTKLSLASFERAGMVVVHGMFDSADDW